jgi:ubiquinone biosynthesis protein UbiJ
MLTATIENVLNRGLPRSPRAGALVAELAGRSLAIEIGGFAQLRVESDGSLLHVATGDSRPLAAAKAADATISGGPLALLALTRDAGAEVLRRGDVTVAGDAQLAQRFQELGRLLRPDLEEELSHWLGDVPAHQLARWTGIGRTWLRRAGDTTLTNLAEYLAHERRDLVPRREGEEFLRGVDAVRESVDRLEARLELLARRRQAP